MKHVDEEKDYNVGMARVRAAGGAWNSVFSILKMSGINGRVKIVKFIRDTLDIDQAQLDRWLEHIDPTPIDVFAIIANRVGFEFRPTFQVPEHYAYDVAHAERSVRLTRLAKNAVLPQTTARGIKK